MSAGPATLLNIQRGDLSVGGWSVVYTYQVFTTSGTDGPNVVLTASGLPAFNAAASFDPLARASRFTPIKQGDATNHWHVEVEYSRETGNQQDTQNPPTRRPTVRSASIRWVEKALQQDKDGDPILTSAKTPFNPPVVVQVPHAVARFQRWENTFSTALIDTYAGKVNATAFGAYAAGRVLCSNIEASEQWEQDAAGELRRYWLVTYEFEASQSWDPWNPLKLLDADFWMIDPSDDKRKPIYITSEGAITNNPLDRNGASPAPSPMPLDSSGVPLLPDELPSGANYLEHDIYDTAEFNDLDLPVY